MSRSPVPLSTLGRQKNQASNDYITTCKHCLGGIYKGQDYGWYDKPLGLSHVACAPERLSSPYEALAAE